MQNPDTLSSPELIFKISLLGILNKDQLLDFDDNFSFNYLLAVQMDNEVAEFIFGIS